MEVYGEKVLTPNQARDVFNNLVASGIIRLHIKVKVDKEEIKKLPMNTGVDCEQASKFTKDVHEVYAGDVLSSWFFYPNQIGDLSPTIAFAGIKYFDSVIGTRMAWDSK